jgi:predicted phosphodiesterase
VAELKAALKESEVSIKESPKGILVLDYLKKYKGYGHKTIARALCTHHPEHFASVEQARNAVRYYNGSFGASGRKHRKIEKTHNGDAHRANPYRIPSADHKDYKPYILDKNARKVLIISDVHVPFHSVSALTSVIDRAKEYQPDTIFINGDFMDCHHLSRFTKDPGTRHFKEELEICRQILDMLLNEIAPTRCVWKEGNHEERYQIYMANRAPELLELDHFNFEKVFGLDVLGVGWVDEKQIVKIGNLPIIHGHEYVRSVFSPVNVAKGYYTKAKSSVMVSHHHQTSEHTDPDILGSVMTAWSIGCLCDLSPKYMPLNRWNHGFAELNLSSSGSFKVDNYRIDKGKLL